MPNSRTRVAVVAPSRYPLALLLVAGLGLGGCGGGGSGRASGGALAPAPSGVTAVEARGAAPVGGGAGKTVAIVGDTALTQSDVLPLLAEAAGGVVLDELALSVAVQAECARRGVGVTDAMVREERKQLARQLAISARLPESEGEGLVEGVRRSRGLGERRFAVLMRTNAGLRAMVRADPGQAVSVGPEDIETAYQLKYGPRYQGRLILVRSRDAASRAAQAIASGQAFADVAAQFSVDPSSSRGGVLEPVSPADSNYPVGVRRALQTLGAGQVSEPIPVEWGGSAGSEAGFAIVKAEGTVSPSGSAAKEAVAGELEQEVRVVRERARMQRLGEQLVRSAGVSVIDPSLSWAWDRYRGSEGR